jgi:DNA polymerase
LADSARFFRQHIEAEGEELISASVAPDGGENTRPKPEEEEEASVQEAEPTYRKDSTKQPIYVQGDDQAFQTAILFDVEPTIQERPLPWEGRPPRQDVDPVGIPDSMTCTVPEKSGERATLLRRLEEETSGCLKCPLGQTRTNYVFGAGSPDAALMFIGEAPGHDEDMQGEPFVGRAGKLLNRIIESIGFVREDVYIGNILKCRPPGNRDPLPGEVEGCEPYLHRQMALIQPAVICALGRIAAQTLLRTRAPLGKLRGVVHRYQGRPLVVTYHPAALLRNPHWKKPTWDDVKLLRQIHDEEMGM